MEVSEVVSAAVILTVCFVIILAAVDTCNESIVRIIREIKRKDYGNKK